MISRNSSSALESPARTPANCVARLSAPGGTADAALRSCRASETRRCWAPSCRSRSMRRAVAVSTSPWRSALSNSTVSYGLPRVYGAISPAVSFGLYAEIVRSPAYRDAKLDTTVSALPGLLGPGSAPFDLRFTDPAGKRHTGAHLVQASNNRYGRTLHTLASRPRLDSGRLGVITLELPVPLRQALDRAVP